MPLDTADAPALPMVILCGFPGCPFAVEIDWRALQEPSKLAAALRHNADGWSLRRVQVAVPMAAARIGWQVRCGQHGNVELVPGSNRAPAGGEGF